MYDAVIIGGGASGLAAAVTAKSRGLKVLVVEANERVGKKLLATGNGKCNLSNANVNASYYNTSFVDGFLPESGKVYAFFNDIGLMTKTTDGRMYPYSESANTVLNALRNALGEENIRVGTAVNTLDKEDGVFVINGNIYAREAVLSTGSNASFGTNSHALAKKFGHEVTPLRPSLTPLITDTEYVKSMANLRVKGDISLVKGGKTAVREKGELLFKNDGISGIAAMNLSAYIARHGGVFDVNIDFAPDKTAEEIEAFLDKAPLEGMCLKAVADNIRKQSAAQKRSVSEVVKRFVVRNASSGKQANAQVTSGGISTEGFDGALQSKYEKGLFATGEVLDVDGVCGGYNLHWAFLSGIIVGENL